MTSPTHLCYCLPVFISVFVLLLIVVPCMHVLVIAIEGEQLEPGIGFEAEAEEPLPEIFE